MTRSPLCESTPGKHEARPGNGWGADGDLTGEIKEVKVTWCCRPPGQKKKQMRHSTDRWEEPHILRLWSSWTFNHPNTCWRDNTARPKQFKKFMECTDDTFLLQVRDKLTRRAATLLDLILTIDKGLIGNTWIKGSLDCSDHETVELRILRAGKRWEKEAHNSWFSCPLCSSRDTYTKLPRAISGWLLKIFKVEDSTAFLGSFCQCLATHTVKKCFLMFRWHLLCSGLRSLPFVRSLGTLQNLLVSGVILAWIQDFILFFVEIHEVSISLSRSCWMAVWPSDKHNHRMLHTLGS